MPKIGRFPPFGKRFFKRARYVVIDDTQKNKRGKKMDAVSKIFLHAEKV